MLKKADTSNRTAIVKAIAYGEDVLACSALQSGAASPQLQREILVEYLLERGSEGAKLVCEMLPNVYLPQREARHLFLAAAESGAVPVLKLLLEKQMCALDPRLLRTAFKAAVRTGHTRVLRMLAHTPLIPLTNRVAAITPSIFTELNGSTQDGSPRSEMGILETQIHKLAREQTALRRSQQAKKPSRKEIATQEIHERYERLIEESARAIRNGHGDSVGRTKQTYSSVTTEMVVEMCTRELVRQRDRAVFDLHHPRPKDYSVTLSSGTSTYRSTNPPGLSARRSVAEIVEAVFAKHQRNPGSKAASWRAMIEAIRKEWGTPRAPLARSALSDLIRERHPEGKTITQEELFLWNQRPDRTPYRRSVEILCQAFKLLPAHELMMWRIARGAAPEEFEKLLKRYRAANEVHSTAKERARLTNALVSFSGVPFLRVQELLRVRQLPMWKRGARIESVAMCKKFVELTNPKVLLTEHQRKVYGDVNDVLVGVLTSRPTSVMEAITRAHASKHPPGTCLLLLTGRYGLMQISERDLAKHLQVPRSTITRMRAAAPKRGGHIIETQAHLIADLVQGVTAEMRGSLTVVERCERELMVDTLTGVRSPVALWHQCISGELRCLGDVVRLTRHRRGDLQLRHTSNFELGKAHVGIRLANRMADYLGFVGEPYRRVRRDFILTAMGLQISATPEDVLDLIISGKESRVDGLRMMLDLSGRTRGQLADVLGIERGTVFTWVRRDFGGRISRINWLRALAQELDLAHRQDDLYEVFTPKVYGPGSVRAQQSS